MFASERETNQYFEKLSLPSDYNRIWWNNTTSIWVTAQEQGLGVAAIYWRLCKDRISNENLWNETNLVVISDHGMTDKYRKNKCHNVLEDCVKETKFLKKVVVESTLLLVHANPGFKSELYKRLKVCVRNGLLVNVDVTWKRDFPERFHYKNAPYVADIILRATNYCTLSCNGPYCYAQYDQIYKGNHGWDNEFAEMQAIFVARGPAFKKNYTANAIEMVDLYQLFCHILGIEMGHTPDGKWDRVTDFLLNNAKNNSSFKILIFVCFILVSIS